MGGNMRINKINIPKEYHETFEQLVALVTRSVKLTGGDADPKELTRVVEWMVRGHDVALIKDEINGDYFSRVNYPRFDEYDLPLECNTVRKYGASMRYKKGEFLPLYISPSFNNTLVTTRLMKYATLLTLIDSVLYTNIDVQRTPYIITASKETLCRIEKLFNELMDGSTLTVDQNNLAGGKIEVFDLKAPWVSDKLYDIKNAVKYDLFTFIGINNSSIDKSEYVSNFETSTNNEATSLYEECIIGMLNDCLKDSEYKAEPCIKTVNMSVESGGNNGYTPDN